MTQDQSIVCPVSVQKGSRWKDTEATLNTGAEVNIISQHFVMKLELKSIKDVELSQSKWINKQIMFCYSTYQVTIWATDVWDQKKNNIYIFYSLNKTDVSLILDMLYFQAEDIMIDYTTLSWYWGVEALKYKILKPKKFRKILRNKPVIYALILSNKNEDVTASMISCKVIDYIDVFFKENAEKLSEHREGDHVIKLNEQNPPFGSLYNLLNSELKTLQEYLNDALTKEWIRHSTSPAGASVLFIFKRDSSLCLCVDYWVLNKITIKNHHTLPLISETLDWLIEVRWFIKFNLKNAYHWLCIRYGDEWKTAFCMWYDHFEYIIMPFGLSNVSATFQAYINKTLADMINVFCVVYFNDILIYSSLLKEHWGYIKQILKHLCKFQLFANLKKCAFAVQQIDFLEFVISAEEVVMDSNQVSTIADWPTLKTYWKV